MNIRRLQRLAWAAVMAEGLFPIEDDMEMAMFFRGKKLEKRQDRRGRYYRTVRDYVVPRVRAAVQEDGSHYIPATLSRLFWEGEWAGNYSWPILRRPEGVAPSAVYSRLFHTRRGRVVSAQGLPREYRGRTYGRESR